MSLRWADVLEIAIQFGGSKPEVDPQYVNFVDLWRWVVELPELSNDPQRSGGKVLGTIQVAWIEERNQPQARPMHLPGTRVQFAGFILGKA